MESSAPSTEMPLDELMAKLVHIEKSLNAIKAKNISLVKDIEDMQKNYIDMSMMKDNMKYKLKNLTDDYSYLIDHTYDLECRLIQVEQYSRRDSVEIMGIPENISQNDLEKYVIKIFHSIGVTDINSYDIAA